MISNNEKVANQVSNVSTGLFITQPMKWNTSKTAPAQAQSVGAQPNIAPTMSVKSSRFNNSAMQMSSVPQMGSTPSFGSSSFFGGAPTSGPTSFATMGGQVASQKTTPSMLGSTGASPYTIKNNN